MRAGNGNQMSPEEQQKVKSIQGTPGERSLRKVSVDRGLRESRMTHTGRCRGSFEAGKSTRPWPPALEIDHELLQHRRLK